LGNIQTRAQHKLGEEEEEEEEEEEDAALRPRISRGGLLEQK
jgi:hypothetical protein